VAVLRCIGAGAEETVCVYLIQIFLLALLSSIIGAAAGVGAQYALPLALKDFLPVTTVISVAPSAVVAGMVVGLGSALLFALIPLVPLRRISPMLALRASFDAERLSRDRLVWILFGLAGFGIWAFAVWTSGSRLSGTWFTLGVLAAFGVLFALSRAVSWLLRRIAPRFLSFSWRQGLANLHRPNNQTATVMLAIGLGTFLLVTLYSAQNMLVAQVSRRAGAGDANMVLFDVQRDQRSEIARLIQSRGLSLRDEVPIVTMRLTGVKGKTIQELRKEAKIP
jgi:putative ABC transport system permease protein